MFIKFVDGNTQNCSIANLERVDLLVALEHIDEWKVDWDSGLSKKEEALVRCPVWRAGLFHRPQTENANN